MKVSQDSAGVEVDPKKSSRMKTIIDDTYSRLLGGSPAKFDRSALLVLHSLLSKTPFKVYDN